LNRREAIKSGFDSIVKAIPSIIGLTGSIGKILTTSDTRAAEEAPTCFPKRPKVRNAHDNTQLTEIANPEAIE
jgi:hypothetical protein